MARVVYRGWRIVCYLRRARKEWACDLCGGKIPAKSLYLEERTLFDRRRVCLNCLLSGRYTPYHTGFLSDEEARERLYTRLGLTLGGSK